MGELLTCALFACLCRWTLLDWCSLCCFRQQIHVVSSLSSTALPSSRCILKEEYYCNRSGFRLARWLLMKTLFGALLPLLERCIHYLSMFSNCTAHDVDCLRNSPHVLRLVVHLGWSRARVTALHMRSMSLGSGHLCLQQSRPVDPVHLENVGSLTKPDRPYCVSAE